MREERSHKVLHLFVRLSFLSIGFMAQSCYQSWEVGFDSDTNTDTENETDSSIDSDTYTSEFIYESGIWDPEAYEVGGASIFFDQYLGSRFTIDAPVRVTHIGGRIGVQSPFFGAIIKMDGAFPLGNPLVEEEMLGETEINEVTDMDPAELMFPLTAELEPGDYALIFGANSANQNGFMPQTSVDTAEGVGSYMVWSGGQESWYTDLDSMRFVVKGVYL